MKHVALMLVVVVASIVAGQAAGRLDAAETAMGTSGLSSLRHEGSGSLVVYGAAHTPDGP